MTGFKHRLLQAQRRAFEDYYSTPSFVTEALLEREEFNGNIWEPCCGEGSISECLKAHKLDVYSSDIKDWGYGEVADFLDTVRDCDHIITNPKYLDNFHLYSAAHAIHIARKKVAFLLPITFCESPRRSRFLNDSPLKAVYVFAYRVWTLRKGYTGTPASRKCFAWFVWERGWKKEPVIRWLTK